MVSDYFRMGSTAFRVDSENGVSGECVFSCKPTDSDLKITVVEDTGYIPDEKSKRYSAAVMQGSNLHITVNPNITGKLTEYKLFNAFDLSGLMLDYGQFVLHSSYVVYNNEAILFTGNSGIGKSTQAEFWKAERGAEIVNGDRCLVSQRNGKYYANGYINCGSSGICRNMSAPIKAVVVLGQAASNNVRKLGGIEAFKEIMPQCAYDIKSSYQTEKIIGLLSDFISTINVLQLDCVNAPSAVECLERYL